MEKSESESPIIITDYNTQWPVLFIKEKQNISKAIGQLVLAIEHIGSTSVPGLGSKPIIDIMVGVKRFEDTKACIEPLVGLGYSYVPEFEAEIPGRRFFRKGTRANATHHIHLVEKDKEFWIDHLFFRDYLRTHPKEEMEYYLLKKELAKKFVHDRDGYVKGKTDFIVSILKKARK